MGAGEPLPRHCTVAPSEALPRTRLASAHRPPKEAAFAPRPTLLGVAPLAHQPRACRAMLKRGRSGVGIELLPAELDFAAAAEIEPVDLTCVAARPRLQLLRPPADARHAAPRRCSGVAPPVPVDASFGAWLAEAVARARLAVAQVRVRPAQRCTATAAVWPAAGVTSRARPFRARGFARESPRCVLTLPRVFRAAFVCPRSALRRASLPPLRRCYCCCCC